MASWVYVSERMKRNSGGGGGCRPLDGGGVVGEKLSSCLTLSFFRRISLSGIARAEVEGRS